MGVVCPPLEAAGDAVRLVLGGWVRTGGRGVPILPPWEEEEEEEEAWTV